MRKLTGNLLSTAMLTVLWSCTAADTSPAKTLPKLASTAQIFNPNADAIKEYMSYLADDGREAGSAGYDKAADYVAIAFEELDLKPAGENGTFFQNIRLKRSYRVADAGNLLVQKNNDDTIDMIKNKDYIIGAPVRHAEGTITAPVVFAVFGVVAPKEGRDDYAGLDVDGKIVAILRGTPSGIEPEERAFYGAQKAKEASDRGAIGVIKLVTKTSEKRYPFERVIKEGSADRAAMNWVKPDGEVFSNAPGLRG